jgi:hypothetical protein
LNSINRILFIKIDQKVSYFKMNHCECNNTFLKIEMLIIQKNVYKKCNVIMYYLNESNIRKNNYK